MIGVCCQGQLRFVLANLVDRRLRSWQSPRPFFACLQFPWYPKPVKNLAYDTDGINDTPSFVVLMDGADKETQDAVQAAVEPIAKEYQQKAKASGMQNVQGVRQQESVLYGRNQCWARPLGSTLHPLLGERAVTYSDVGLS